MQDSFILSAIVLMFLSAWFLLEMGIHNSQEKRAKRAIKSMLPTLPFYTVWNGEQHMLHGGRWVPTGRKRPVQ